MAYNEGYQSNEKDFNNGREKFSMDEPGSANEAEQREQDRRDQDPLWFCKLVVRAPELTFGKWLVLSGFTGVGSLRKVVAGVGVVTACIPL